MSFKEKKIIRKYNSVDLFNQALAELFNEDLIKFIDNKTVDTSTKGEEMYIIPDKIYKKRAKVE